MMPNIYCSLFCEICGKLSSWKWCKIQLNISCSNTEGLIVIVQMSVNECPKLSTLFLTTRPLSTHFVDIFEVIRTIFCAVLWEIELIIK